MKQILMVTLMLLTLTIISACSPPPHPTVAPPPGMPNPAAVHCSDQGGEVEIRDEAGGQAGYCIFPDGSECEEWAFFRGECAPGDQKPIGKPNPASVNCMDKGGKLEIRDKAEGQVGYCIFPDGSECEEWAFFKDESAPGGGEGKAGMPNPASKNCVDQGGKVDIRDEAGGQVGYCVFSDGSECEEWAYFKGECAPGGSYQPLDSAACTDLTDSMSKTIGVEVETDTVAFDDYVTSESGTGCVATATGTGADFESFPKVAGALKEMLVAKGWAEDMQYAADGPTSTAAGFRQEDKLCLLQVGWNPSEDANCPSDQPISACELAPEQQLYTIVLNCAQTGAMETES